jgi:hypothetical protein
MGYSTNFTGKFIVSPTLNNEDRIFLTKLAQTRRVKRNVGPEYGVEGEFYVDGKGFCGQDCDETVINGNQPPATQPGLWCQWIPTEDGTAIEWDGNEKFYNYVEWIEYIINWLKPKGYVVNGEVEWQGEDSDDFGKIVVVDNVVSIKIGKKTFE